MKSKFRVDRLGMILMICGLIFFGNTVKAQDLKIKNVVLVHGAFASRSGWQDVYKILKKQGYNVTVVQIPLTSLNDDVNAVNCALDRLDGKAVLVGHSWSGTVITVAGVHPKVASLVYVDAFQPDEGETTLQWVQSAPTLPESGLLPPDANGFVYFDKEKFHVSFAADLSKEEAQFMADSQQPIAVSCFTDVVTTAAWHNKPSYGILGTADKSINPEILRAMYKRSAAKVTEIKGASHVVFISHAKEVARVIHSATI
tara:strand:- start:24128 stop:24898 length:771 start_codon:yes stop_codon:yes gene_type:complete